MWSGRRPSLRGAIAGKRVGLLRVRDGRRRPGGSGRGALEVGQGDALAVSLLEARGFTVYLVNTRHVKSVPGRKSDVLDCQ